MEEKEIEYAIFCIEKELNNLLERLLIALEKFPTRKKAILDHKNSKGETLITHALFFSNYDAINILINNGFDLQKTTKEIFGPSYPRDLFLITAEEVKKKKIKEKIITNIFEHNYKINLFSEPHCASFLALSSKFPFFCKIYSLNRINQKNISYQNEIIIDHLIKNHNINECLFFILRFNVNLKNFPFFAKKIMKTNIKLEDFKKLIELELRFKRTVEFNQFLEWKENSEFLDILVKNNQHRFEYEVIRDDDKKEKFKVSFMKNAKLPSDFKRIIRRLVGLRKTILSFFNIIGPENGVSKDVSRKILHYLFEILENLWIQDEDWREYYFESKCESLMPKVLDFISS